MNIYYLQDASGGFEKFAPYLETLRKFVEREGSAVGLHLEQLKKHKDLSLYSIRVNEERRILLVKYQGQFCLVDVVLNHDYHKSRFYNNLSLFHVLLSRSASVVEASSFKDLVADKEAELWEPVAGDELGAFIAAVSSGDSKKAMEYQHGRLIALNSIQEEALSASLPVIVSGPAGSGKSSLALSMLSQYLRNKEGDAAFPVIYVTQNANLVGRMEQIWREMVADVHGADRVVFKSYEQMLAEDLRVEEATFVGEKAFLKWYPGFVKSAKLSSAIDAKTIWIECRIRSGYSSHKEYVALGRRQSSLTDLAARDRVCRIYDAFLASISPAQLVPVLDAPRRAFVSPYQLFIVDEAQDLSFGQLRRLHELSKGSIVFFLGDHQLLFDTTSRLDYLKGLYHGGPYKAQVIALASTYRCSKEVSLIANALITIKYRITGGASDKLSGMLEAAEDVLLGAVEGAAFRYDLIKDRVKIDALVEQARSSEQCVVVTLEEHKKEAQEFFGKQALVMTAENVKGLEFERVILWRLLDCQQAKEAVRILSSSVDPSGHRPKSGKGDATYEPYCNALITAATRAKNQVVMVQSFDRDIEPILVILDDAFRKTEKSAAELSALLPSTQEEWISRALELNESGLKQEALGIYLSHLKGSNQTFDAFINAHRKKSAVAALEEAVTTSPTLSVDGGSGAGEPYEHELGLLEQVCRGLILSPDALHSLKKALSSTVGKPTLLGHLVEKRGDLLRQMSDDLLLSIEPAAWQVKLKGKKNKVPLLLDLVANEEHGLVVLWRLFVKDFTFEFDKIPEKVWLPLIPRFTNTSKGTDLLKLWIEKAPTLREMLKKILGNLWKAASEGDIATIRLYFALGYKLDSIQKSTGDTPATLAVRSEQLSVLEVLHAYGINLNSAAGIAVELGKLHILKKIYSLCPTINIVDLILVAITSNQPEALSFLIEHSDFFAINYVISVAKLMELCKESGQVEVESRAKILIRKLLSQGQNVSSLVISPMDFAVFFDRKRCISVLESVTENTATRSDSEQNENFWTPARLLWLNWIRRQSKVPEDVVEGKQLDQMTVSDFECFVTETICFPSAFPADFKDYHVTFKALQSAWGLQDQEEVTFLEFQRLMDLFARPESHFLFSGAVHAAFIAARSPLPGSLYQNPIARVEHVAQALLPIASALFADAVNSSIYGAINGAWVGFLPKVKVEELLRADGRIGAFVVGLGEERSCGVVLSYLTNPHLLSGLHKRPSDVQPKIVHQILDRDNFRYFLRGRGCGTLAHAIAFNKSFLRYPCHMASLAVRLGTPAAALITVPQREVLHSRPLQTLLQDGCGNIDPTRFNIKYMQRIGNAINTVLDIKSSLDNPFLQKHLFEVSNQGGVIRNPRVLLPIKVRQMLDLLSSGEPSLTEFEFNGFHGIIDYTVTTQRLNGTPNTYLIRESTVNLVSFILAWENSIRRFYQTMISPASQSPKVECSETTFTNVHSCLKFYSFGINKVLGQLREPYPLPEYVARAVSWNSLNTDLLQTGLDSNNDSYLPPLIKSLESVWSSLKELRQRGQGEVLALTEGSASSVDSGFTVSEMEEAEQKESFWTPASLLWLNWSRKLLDSSDALVDVISMEQFECFVNEMLTFPDSLKLRDSVFNESGHLVSNSPRVTFAMLQSVWGLSKKSEIKLEDFQRLMDIFVRPETYLSFRAGVRAAFIAARFPFEGDLDKNPHARIEHVAQVMLPIASAIFADAVNSSIFGCLNGAWVGFMPDKIVADFLRADGRIGAFVVGFSDEKLVPVIFYLASKSTKSSESEVRPDSDLIIEKEILIHNSSLDGYIFNQVSYKEIVHAVVCNESLLLYPCISASLSLRLNNSEVAAMVVPEIEVPLSKQYRVLLRAGCGKIDRAHFNPKFMKRIQDALHDVLSIDRNIIDGQDLQKILFESAEIATPKSALCLPEKAQQVLRLKPGNYFFDGFHGIINYEKTLARFKDKPNASYLVRASQAEKGAYVLAFRDAAGVVQQTKISPSPEDNGKVICSDQTFCSLSLILTAYKIPPSADKEALLSNTIEPYASIVLSSPEGKEAVICSNNSAPSFDKKALLSNTIAPYPLEESIARASSGTLLIVAEAKAVPVDEFPAALSKDLKGVWNSIRHFRDRPLPVIHVAVMGKAFIRSASTAPALASESTSVENARGLHGFFSPASLSTAIGSRKQLRGYDIYRVPPDGNCFFHAVVDQLQQLGIKDPHGEYYTHELLRGLVASFVASNPELREFFVDEELTELTTVTGWVGHEAIKVLATILKVIFIIIKDEEFINDVLVEPTGLTAYDVPPVLYLYYNGRDHYDSLRTTNSVLLNLPSTGLNTKS